MVVLSKQLEDDSAVCHASIGERNRSSMFNTCFYKKKTGKKDHKEPYSLMLKGVRSQPFEKGGKRERKADCSCISEEIKKDGFNVTTQPVKGAFPLIDCSSRCL